MENKSGKREWVKTAAIVFLSILLVLTFFSNTIMNRTLPEVSTEAVASGTITAKVRGSGTVSAIGSNEVKATGTRSIAAVKIKAGQEVNEGDVLFVMGSAADEEVETAKDTYDDLYYALQSALASYPTNTYSIQYDEALRAYADAQVATAIAKTAWDEYLRTANVDLAEAQTNLYDAEQHYQQLSTNLEDYRETLQNEYLVAKEYYEALIAIGASEEEIEAARLAAEAAKSKWDDSYSINDPYVQELQKVQQDINLYSAKVDYYSSDDSQYRIAYETALSNENSAQAKVESLYNSYNSSTASYNQSAATYSVNVAAAQNRLDRQEEKIASLTGEGEDANVYAKVSGIVESVNFSAGDTVVKDDILCTIEVPDQGYTVTISVTKEQAGRLQIGDTADISNYYWGSSITATVSSIKTDPKNPQSNKLVTFDITGDVTTGQELKIAIGQKSASYDCVVPNSAVMSDSNGKFVLTVESKQSPLGNRYFARRVDVDVLGSDDINSAVNGNIGNGDFVITTSSIHINNGDQVRLSDAG